MPSLVATFTTPWAAKKALICSATFGLANDSRVNDRVNRLYVSALV